MTELPSYEYPPVVEVVWGVQFSKLPWLSAAHTGLFWEKIRADYPQCEEKPPIQRKVEPEKFIQSKPLRAEFTSRPPLCRQLFVSENGNDLVQLQPNWFCVNWRKQRDGDVYPRYEYMQEVFEKRWSEFCEFAEKEGGQAPNVDLLEMSYINHLFHEDAWDSPQDIAKIFPALSFDFREGSFLPTPATVGANMTFDMEGRSGRLHISCKHAQELTEYQREFFRLSLIARGHPQDAQIDKIGAWFAKARSWIVQGFTDITNKQIQEKVWGRLK